MTSFSGRHVIAEANGGATVLENLKPICTRCNSSMGTTNMMEFAKQFPDSPLLKSIC